MMWPSILLFLVQVSSAPVVQQSMQQAAARCVEVESPDLRNAEPMAIAPGAPPVLSFRYYEGQLHRRYSNSDLMLDDAGH
jgi:hypothetical protein